jgi:hypothetical protein
MTLALITKDNLYSQPSLNIFTILNTRTYVPDPRNFSGLRKFVYNSDPLMKALDSKGEPYIICPDALEDFPTNKSADAKKEFITWSQDIIVRTKKEGSSGSNTDLGITDMRSIIDSIIKTFKSATVKGILRAYDMYNVDIAVVNVDDVLINQDILFETSLQITYSTRISVSD